MSGIIENHTDEAIAAMREALTVALEMMGQKAEGYAKQICPVDTGNLRNSITHRQEGDDTEVIGSAVEYAPYVLC